MSIFSRFLTLFGCIALVQCTPSDKQSATNGTVGRRSDSLEYHKLIQENTVFRLNQEGDSLREEGKYQEAMGRYQMAMDSAAVDADSFGYYDARLDLATIYDRVGQIQTAISLTLPIIDAYIRSGDSTRIGRGYSTLAVFYGKAKMREENIKYAKLGFDILKQNPSLPHRCAAYNQMAFTYSDAGNWAAAMPLLDSALQFMIASGETDFLAGMQLNVGDCHRNLGHYAEAKKYFEAALAGADSLHQTHIKAKVFDRLSQVAEATGQPALALQLFRKYKSMMDSIFTEEKTAKLQQLDIEYKSREKEQEIQTLRAANAAETSKNNAIIAISVCLLAILGILYFRRRETAKRDALALENSRKDLQQLLLLLQEKNRQLGVSEQSAAEPEAIPTAPQDEEKTDETAENLYNVRILTDSDWETFKSFFERSHPKFIYRIRNRFPQLTNAEERLLLLIKLKFSRQEIASTLGISPESVKKGRQRLRKKLDLEQEDGLDSFIERLK